MSRFRRWYRRHRPTQCDSRLIHYYPAKPNGPSHGWTACTLSLYHGGLHQSTYTGDVWSDEDAQVAYPTEDVTGPAIHVPASWRPDTLPST